MVYLVHAGMLKDTSGPAGEDGERVCILSPVNYPAAVLRSKTYNKSPGRGVQNTLREAIDLYSGISLI